MGVFAAVLGALKSGKSAMKEEVGTVRKGGL